MRLLDPRDEKVEWDHERGKPTSEGVAGFLSKVIRRDFIDAKKLPRHTTTRRIEEEKTAERMATNGTSPEDVAVERVDRIRRRDALFAFIGEDPEVLEYLRLQLPDESVVCYPPRKAAELLKTTIHDVNNRKKKVARYLRDFEASRAGELYG
ncbi:MAG: hypothetical protein QOC81_839 [Thermoanaerobaculia bacterium]|nr:hypothetical protein [Thermoanaerobaculia bacterium]